VRGRPVFEEYAQVWASRDLSPVVKKGTCGCVVMIYRKDPGAYEVEFFDGDMHLCVLTVKESDLVAVDSTTK
jgi:hypothetical protein